MGQLDPINPRILDWLFEEENPGVRYLARRNLTSSTLSEMTSLQEKTHQEGPIATVLSKMQPEGYWIKPGPGYSQKYCGTVWSLILLSQLGADCLVDKRIGKACNYYLDHAQADNGQLSYNGAPGGTIDCLQGNMLSALLDLGYTDARLDKAFEWMARTVTGEGMATLTDKSAPMRYYAYKCGPLFACGANGKKSCAWGAAKVMLAFSKLPLSKRTPLINRAIQAGIDFLFSCNPVTAGYPTRTDSKPSRDWWKFGFPVFYITDILQIAEALVGLHCGNDPRLADTLRLIRDKQDETGRWKLEFDYPGKTWMNFGVKNEANKWVTLRALRVLSAVK
jgi:hypothetical protein